MHSAAFAGVPRRFRRALKAMDVVLDDEDGILEVGIKSTPYIKLVTKQHYGTT